MGAALVEGAAEGAREADGAREGAEVGANTNGADSETNESQPMCASSSNDSGNSVWYSYTPAVNGNASFSSRQ